MPKRAGQDSRHSPGRRRQTLGENPAGEGGQAPAEASISSVGQSNHELSQLLAALARRMEEQAAELNNEIARREEIERKLQDTSVFLDTVIENLPSMLCVKDAKD